MKKIMFLTIVAAIGLGFMSYKFTHAYFTASAVSAENTFKTAESFATPSATLTPTPDHVVINEVSPVGSSSADWVELYNPTNSAVNVSSWTIADNNGSPNTIPTSPQIPSKGYAIITTDNPTVLAIPNGVIKIQLTSGTIGGAGGLAAGGDKIVLNNGTNDIDKVSWGSDPSVFSEIGVPSGDQTIQRIPNGQDTNTASDWKLSTPTLGGVNQ
jgi:hypothetical protein